MRRRVAVGLGASLGDRRATLERTLRQLDVAPLTRVVRASRWYLTPPMRGSSARGWFLNGVALLETEQRAEDLLALCVELEARAGRRRARYWGDRPLDLDVLLVDHEVLHTERLEVPHPAIARRAFVLLPLREVWPEAVDPRTGSRWADLPLPPGPRPVPVGVVARRRPLMYL